jgi:hypothetical protein
MSLVDHAQLVGQTELRTVSLLSEAFGTAHQPLEPTSLAIKKTPEGAPRGGRSKLTQPDTQRVRTGQPDDAQGFFGSMTSPRSTEHRCKTLLDSGTCRP